MAHHHELDKQFLFLREKEVCQTEGPSGTTLVIAGHYVLT